MSAFSPVTRALAAMLAGAAAIAFAPIFVRLSEVGPTATAFWRCALAVPVIALFLRWPGQAMPPPAAIALRPLILAGAFFAADLGLWHVSILWTTVANATLLANLAPFFVAGFAFFVRRQPLGRATWGALASAGLGIALLTRETVALGGQRLMGDMLGVATAAAYAGYMIAVARARRQAGTMAVALTTSAVAALFLAPIAWAAGEAMLPASIGGWAVLGGLALVSQAAGQGLIVYALAHLPVTFGALALLLQPVIAAALAWGLFGEAMSGVEMTGGMIVLLAIFLARLDAVRPAREAAS
jgi:drug/metabolite transporter (DMT)-like permease